MVPIIITLTIGGTAALIGLIVFLVRKHEKARTEQFEGIAHKLALEFYPTGDPAVQDAHSHLHLFKQGRHRTMKNLICGRNDDVTLAIFGYRYITGSGKNQRTHSQTVFSFQSAKLSLPEFEIRPEHIFHKIGQAFGYKDIDFSSHPEFSKRYVLRGGDDSAVHSCFTPERLSFFETQEGINVEASEDRLIYYKASKRIKPEALSEFMEEGSRLYALFKEP